MTSTFVLSSSTLVSTLRKFPPRQPFKCSLQNSRRLVCQEIHIPAWPTHYSKAYNLFHLSSFNENGCKFPKVCCLNVFQKISRQDPSLTLQEYFQCSLYRCAYTFCTTHLKCCPYCGDTSHRDCGDQQCLDCDSDDHLFRSCPKLLRWLHDPVNSHHLIWKNVVTDWIISNPPPRF
jgi:hypothetical protein